MRFLSITMLVGLMLFLFPGTSLYAVDDIADTPWETYGVNGGVFLSDLDTSFKLGTDLGLSVDVEELLHLDSSNTVFRVNGLWRFTENKRHRMDLSWFAFHRNGSNIIGRDIQIEKRDGDIITIDATTQVNAVFDIDIFQGTYSYSFLQDDRIDFAASLGLYVMPVNFGISASDITEKEGHQDFVAPLPTIGLRLDIALAPQWFFRSGSQFFYLKSGQFKGSLLTMNTAVEYKPWDHMGIGLGIDSFKLNLEADGEDYPAIDLRGKVTFEYVGVQLYARFYF